jgi:hypothetical protein
MTNQPERLSEHLKATRNRLSEFRHGGIVLEGEHLEAFVRRFDAFVQKAEALECLVRASDWTGRAAADRVQLLTPASIVVLETMRPNSNVVSFRRPEAPSPFNGGDAA